MTEPNETQQASIGNGAAIIERFGGIRPMASKINVPVTTVQGWKKRDAIPVSRIEQIQQAAREHNLDISDILKASNENEKPVSTESSASVRAEKVSSFESRFDTRLDNPGVPAPSSTFVGPVTGDVAKKILQAERKAIAKSMAINFVFIIGALGAAFALLWPGSPFSKSAQDVTALEQKVAELKIDIANVRRASEKIEGGSMGVVIPPEVQQKIDELQKKIDSAAQNATAQSGTQDMTAFEQRLAKLEQGAVTTATATAEAVSDVADDITAAAANVQVPASVPASATMNEIINRYMAAEATQEGSATLNSAWASLVAAMSSAPSGTQPLSAALHAAATQNPNLGNVLANANVQQIEAAAGLFAMAQMRAKLGRENVPVESDLRVLKTLTGTNPALGSAIDALMPMAGKGAITSAEGLSKNLSSISAEVIRASMSGEGASIKDMAKAQIGQVMQVEKHGQAVTGTAAQAAITQAQKLLAGGDISGAVSRLRTITGPAAGALVPWLENAQATLTARQLHKALTQAITAQVQGTSAAPTFQ